MKSPAELIFVIHPKWSAAAVPVTVAVIACCCVQVDPERVNTNILPASWPKVSSNLFPTTKYVASEFKSTPDPNLSFDA